MTCHIRNRVHLPPSLALLVTHRARDYQCNPVSVIREALMAFAALPSGVRQIHLFEYHWDELASEGWEAFYPDADTLRMAGLAKLGAWSRDQTLVAAVSWYLVAF